MKIALYLDAFGTIARLGGGGRIRVYDDTGGAWRPLDERPFPFPAEASLAEVKAAVAALADWLGDCRTFVSGANRGLVYSLLQEEAGFRVWQSHGRPEDQLDHLARRDAALAEQRRQESEERAFAALFSSPSGGGCGGGGGGSPRRRRTSPEAIRALRSLTQPLGEGRYRIDLAAVLEKYRTANSMDVLLPLLEAGGFTAFEILCDHLPRWFHGTVADLDLDAEFGPRPGARGGVRATVFPRPAATATTEGPRQ